MPPYPVLLFTRQRIIDEAHQITGKVVERVLHATLASLTAKPIDDIVQALYNEHYIHLLDRNGAEHDDFEFFYAPYPTMIHNLDFKTLTDQRRGTIFALDVPFTGEARRTRPTAVALKAPLGFVGENKDRPYLEIMKLNLIQDYAIQARVAAVIGATVFDRVFAGVKSAETDGPLLYVYAKDEQSAAEIEDNFSLLIADIASRILKREVEPVVLLPKVLQ